MKRPDLMCDYCERYKLATIHDEACVDCLGVEVDKRVRLKPTRKARCGHISFSYFACRLCKEKSDDSLSFKEMYGICKKLQRWNPETLSYKEAGPAGDAWRKLPRLLSARGYTYNTRTKNYQVRFQTKHVGTAATADEARAMYVKRVEEFRIEMESKKNG